MTVPVAQFKRLDSPGPGLHSVVDGAERQAGKSRSALLLPELEQNVVLRRGQRVAVFDVVVGRTEIERVVLRSYTLETLTHTLDGIGTQGGRVELRGERLLHPLRQVRE